MITNFDTTTLKRQQKTQRITLEIDVVGDEIDSEQCEKIADSFTDLCVKYGVCQIRDTSLRLAVKSQYNCLSKKHTARYSCLDLMTISR